MKTKKLAFISNRKDTVHLLYRWLLLFTTAFLLLIKRNYHFEIDFELSLFLLLMVYNLLISLAFPLVARQKLTLRLLMLADTIIGLSVLLMTGQMQSPFLLYILFPLISYIARNRFWGAIEVAVALTVVYVVFYLSLQEAMPPMGSWAENGKILALSGSFLAFVYGFPVQMMLRLERKNEEMKDMAKRHEDLEEFNRSLVLLHDIACRMNGKHNTRNVMMALIKLCCSIFESEGGKIYLMTEQGPMGYGNLSETDSMKVEESIREYVRARESCLLEGLPLDEKMILIPVDRGSKLQGFLALKKAKKTDLSRENALLFSMVANMLSSYLENLEWIHEIEQKVTENERKRIAHVLHEGPAQSLFFAGAEIQKCRKLLKTEGIEDIDDKLGRIQKRLLENVQEIRRHIYDLKASVMHRENVVEIIGSFLDRVRTEFNLEVYYNYRVYQEVELGISKELFSLVQESVSHAIEQANAGRVRVSLEVRDEIVLTVSHNGKALDVEELSKGSLQKGDQRILALREQVESLGGSMQIESYKGKGTTLYISIPNRKAEKSFVLDRMAYGG